MISLIQHLAMLSHRDLRGIATRPGLRRRLDHDSGSWSALIADAWRNEAFAQHAVARLSPPALAALARLRAAGSLPQVLFLAEYGAIRRAGAGRQWQPPPSCGYRPCGG